MRNRQKNSWRIKAFGFFILLSLIFANVPTIINAVTVETDFTENFNNSVLDQHWVESGQLGSFSLTANQGFLRQYLLGHMATGWAWRNGAVGGWTPSKCLSRSFDGTSWTLQTKVTFNLHESTPSGGSPGAQTGQLWVAFGDGTNYFNVERGVDKEYNANYLNAYIGDPQTGGPLPFAPGDVIKSETTGGWVRFTYWFELQRDAQHLKFRYSGDGVNYLQGFDITMNQSLGNSQRVILSSTVWDTYDSYIDWGYVKINSPPLVVATPAVITVSAGQIATFSVNASTGTTPYTYQWYENTTLLPGQNSAQLALNRNVAGNYTFYCNVTDSALATTKSNTVTLAVTDFVVSVLPSIQSVIQGLPTTYTVILTGLGGFNQAVSLTTVGLPIGASASFNPAIITPTSSGATSTLTIQTSISTPAEASTITVTGTEGTLTHASTIQLTVKADDTSLIALVLPTNATAVTGQTVTFSVDASGGKSPYTYQWYEGTATSPGQTTNQIAIKKTTAGSFTFYCKVTDSNGKTANSNQVTLKINTPLAISVFPINNTVVIGQTATFSANATGGIPPFTIQWYEGANPLPGQTDSQLKIAKETNGTYKFYSKITDSEGQSANSSEAMLLVTFVVKENDSSTTPIIFGTSAIAIIVGIITIWFFFINKAKAGNDKRFFIFIDDPTADKAIEKDFSNINKKLEIFKARHPEMASIRPSISTKELFDKTGISIEKRQ